jgi:hypothetical protein
MKNAVLAGLLLALGASLRAGSLDLPPRPPTAPKGTEFARSIAALPLRQREEKILAEVMAGNVPPFLRTFVPVTVTTGALTATYDVAPDYLAIGSDDDYFLTPLTPYTAQIIADRLDCCLPTRKMVDDIYASAMVKLTPAPIPPSREMTTVPVFLRHNEMVHAQRSEHPPGGLVAGHKKDVVIANNVFTTMGRVAIYGWHKADGKPIQPLYIGHTASWADYSHGIRLVRRRMTVGGEAKTLDEVLADPRLAPLVSDEGVLLQSRYDLKEFPTERQPAKLKAAPGETNDVLWLDPDVRVVINRPEADSSKPVLLVFYALPNGGTIEQAIGKAMEPEDDWHFDIQHIGAQTRFLRERITDRTLVVAYLENVLLSWPAWRRENGDGVVLAIVDAVRDRFPDPRTRIVLSGHSGGGSLTFGYLDCVATIPDQVERIALLDSNYAYETDRHCDKLAAWLKGSNSHHLVVLAYNDAVALLDCKPFVSATGGTWGRSHQMLGDLGKAFPLARDLKSGMQRFTGRDGRVKFLLKENPEREILHTVQVERNGFIECLLAGTRLEGAGYTYFGDRAYTRFIMGEGSP